MLYPFAIIYFTNHAYLMSLENFKDTPTSAPWTVWAAAAIVLALPTTLYLLTHPW
jgi:ABC-type maltose transport system permease subunit